MSPENSFSEAFNRFTESSGNLVGSLEGSQYAVDVQDAIDLAVEEIENAASSNLDIQYAKGFVAEPWHSGTHNIDAVAKGVKARTTVDGSTEFGSSDVSGNWGEKFGLKYYKNGAESAKAQSKSYFERYCESRSKHPDQSFMEFLEKRGIDPDEVLKHESIYQGQTRIIPRDQLKEAIDFLRKQIQKETDSRPFLNPKLQDTLDNLSDRVRSPEGSESVPLSEEESRIITREARRYGIDRNLHGLTAENFVKWEYILRESGEAALHAALISAVIKASPHIWKCLRELLNSGEISSESLEGIGTNAFSGAAQGAMRGGLAAAITASCKTGLLGDSLRSVDPSIVATATVLAMRTAQNAIRLSRGNITEGEFTEAILRDSFVLSVGVAGATIFQGLIPIPILGALLGNFMGSILAGLVYDGVDTIFIAFCINTGFSFFKVVEQSYTLSEHVLKEMGLDVIRLELVEMDAIDFDEIELDEIQLDSIDISVLERGLIQVRRIGYIPA